MKIKIKFYILFFLLFAGYSSAHLQNNCPYPVIFLHGWTGNETSFHTFYSNNDFENIWGPLTDVFHAVANATTETNIWGTDGIEGTNDDDVLVQFVNETNNLTPGCIYAFNLENFWNEDQANPRIEYHSGESPTWDDSDSNESALQKHGYILKKVIEKVLAANPAKEKVIIVAHSMGGLTTREYLQRRTPENASGTPKWWVSPNVPDGHKIVKVITTVTPHLGSNTMGNLDPVHNPHPENRAVDLNSEAVRDMRYNWSCGFLGLGTCPGAYLYGGDEAAGWGWWNEDVNCDGDETDTNIKGINISGEVQGTGEIWHGTYDNPDLPLPDNIHYTWITSDITGFDGDGVVAWSRQWLHDGSTPKPSDGTPFRLTDTLHTEYFHTNVNDDVTTLIRGFDEGDYPKFSWKIQLDELYSGIAQARATNIPEGNSTTDPDWYSLFIPSSFSENLQIQLTPASNLSGRIDFFAANPGDYTMMSTESALSIAFSPNSSVNLNISKNDLTPGSYCYFRIIHENVNYESWKNPFTIKAVPLSNLPVELVRFYGKKQNSNIELSWHTLSETNLNYFEIEKASNTTDFHKIGFKKAIGNSSTLHKYSFTDSSPLPENNYYRLKIINLDGSTNYSNVIVIPFSQGIFSSLNVFPNPAKNQLFVEFSSNDRREVSISLANIYGQIIQNKNFISSIGQNQVIFTLQNLPEGLYLLTLGNEKTVKVFKKF